MTVRGKSLTDTWLRVNNGKLTDKEVTKSDGNGLEARLRDGLVTFIYRPRLITGQRIKLTLGKYPEMSLSQARDKVLLYKKVVADGGDPRKAKRAEIIKQSKEPTLNEVYNYWYEGYCKPHRSRSEECLNAYNNNVGKNFGNLYYKDIARHTLVQHLMKLAAVKPGMIGKVLSELKQSITYAIDHDFLQHPNIIASLRGNHLGIKKGRGSRTLDKDEIKEVLDALEDSATHERNNIIVRLLLFYGCRGGELRQTQRSWLNFEKGTWTVPAEYHKTGRKSGMPLIRPIIEEVKPLWERAMELSPSRELVFTSIKHKIHVTDNPLKENAFESIPFHLQSYINIKRNKRGQPKMPHFSNHDLRRTARSFFSKFGEWAVCEKMLGHKIPGDSDTYDYHDYVDKMIPVYKSWWTMLQAIEHGEGKVVSLRA